MTASLDKLHAARAQFPITRTRVYLDTANTGTPPTCVTQTLAAYFARQQDDGGDKKGAVAAVETTRDKVATLLGCDAGEIAFVKNTSEGLNIAAQSIDWRDGDNVVIPSREHPNNVFPWLNLRRHGVEIRLAKETGDWVDADMLRPYVDARTRVVAVADVSFAPGQRNDVASIAALCDKVGAHLVVDGVQAVGLLTVQLRELGVAMWAASGHKGLMTPHGLGLFYCRRDLIPNLSPAYTARASMMTGAGDDHLVQDPDSPLRDDARRFEIGNHNYSGIQAMGAALDLIGDIGIATIEQHVLRLGEYLTERLAERQIARLGPKDPKRRSSICVFALPGEGWVEYFVARGIIVSGRLGAIRVSIGLHNSRDDIDRFVAVLDERLER
jgi:selenocysteine lyase/cysteine desulfurase